MGIEKGIIAYKEIADDAKCLFKRLIFQHNLFPDSSSKLIRSKQIKTKPQHIKKKNPFLIIVIPSFSFVQRLGLIIFKQNSLIE